MGPSPRPRGHRGRPLVGTCRAAPTQQLLRVHEKSAGVDLWVIELGGDVRMCLGEALAVPQQVVDAALGSLTPVARGAVAPALNSRRDGRLPATAARGAHPVPSNRGAQRDLRRALGIPNRVPLCGECGMVVGEAATLPHQRVSATLGASSRRACRAPAPVHAAAHGCRPTVVASAAGPGHLPVRAWRDVLRAAGVALAVPLSREFRMALGEMPALVDDGLPVSLAASRSCARRAPRTASSPVRHRCLPFVSARLARPVRAATRSWRDHGGRDAVARFVPLTRDVRVSPGKRPALA